MVSKQVSHDFHAFGMEVGRDSTGRLYAVTLFYKELVMNASWTILLAVYMAARLAAQVGIAAPAAPPASGQIPTEQTQATMVPATLVSAPGAVAVAFTSLLVLCTTTVLQCGTVVVAAR